MGTQETRGGRPTAWEKEMAWKNPKSAWESSLYKPRACSQTKKETHHRGTSPSPAQKQKKDERRHKIDGRKYMAQERRGGRPTTSKKGP